MITEKNTEPPIQIKYMRYRKIANNALSNISEEIFATLGVLVKFSETGKYNGYTSYDSQDLSKLTGILGGNLIKRATLRISSKDKPLDDGSYWWKIDWHFDFGSGSNGNEYATIWTNADGEILEKR